MKIDSIWMQLLWNNCKCTPFDQFQCNSLIQLRTVFWSLISRSDPVVTVSQFWNWSTVVLLHAWLRSLVNISRRYWWQKKNCLEASKSIGADQPLLAIRRRCLSSCKILCLHTTPDQNCRENWSRMCIVCWAFYVYVCQARSVQTRSWNKWTSVFSVRGSLSSEPYHQLWWCVDRDAHAGSRMSRKTHNQYKSHYQFSSTSNELLYSESNPPRIVCRLHPYVWIMFIRCCNLFLHLSLVIYSPVVTVKHFVIRYKEMAINLG
jgi:hypothetical protein